MDGHFRAFSFVDRIVAIAPGRSIHGRYHIPARLNGFPLSLVSEAIGQTAAWNAMSSLDFRQRPVAGIAECVELLAEPRVDATLEITVEIHSVEVDAVAYSGVATIGSQPIVRLSNCVGPMVPLEEFDSPEVIRQRFHLLCNPGAEPDLFPGVDPLPLVTQTTDPGRQLSATLQAPKTAGFFSDHFPRRPVLPGTLLMDANLRLAVALLNPSAASPESQRWTPTEVRGVKLRAFVEPGETLEIEARVKEQSGSAASISVQTKRAGRGIGSALVLLREKEDG